MIIQTQAIALQLRPWSQTSHMVTWLTPDHGKIVTAVKGACRPKSAFLGQYDLFYTCELLFYRREHDGVHAIRECRPLSLREPLRRCWRSAAAAACIADLTARVTASHQESGPVFSLLSDTLDALTDTRGEAPALKRLLLWYEIHLLLRLGLMPDLATCPRCHPPERPYLRFSLPSGRFACQHLAKSHPGEATLPVQRAVLNALTALRDSPAPRLSPAPNPPLDGKKIEAETNLLFGLSRFLGMFMAFHLDVPPAVRRVTWEMLDITPAQKPALLENSKS